MTGDFLSDPKCYWDPVGQRFIQTILEVDAPGNFNGAAPFNRTHVLIAVSQTSDPTGKWNLYSLDTSDDGRTAPRRTLAARACRTSRCSAPTGTGCSSTPTSSRTTPASSSTEARFTRSDGPALESGASSVGFDHLNVGTVPTGDANLPFWGSIQPSTSIDPGRGTELLMTGGPEDTFQNNAPLDNRIAVWSLTGTGSLGNKKPSVALRHVVLTSETYGLPINTGATQKDGPTPLRDALGDVDPLETINANDSRMNQVVDVDGVLYGGVNTTVTSATGPSRVGIAFFVVTAVGTPGGIVAQHRPPGLRGREWRERAVPLDRGQQIRRRRDVLHAQRARLLPQRRLRAVRPGPDGRLDPRHGRGHRSRGRLHRLPSLRRQWCGPLG